MKGHPCAPILPPSGSIFQADSQTVSAPELKKVSGLVVRGRTIAVGDTYDSALEVLMPSDQTNQSIHRDKQGNMILLKHYDADGKKFCLTVSRIEDPGPYRILLIDMI